MLLAYTLTDGPLHAEHHAASAQVVLHGARPCRFVWTIDILPNPLAGRVAELTEAGLRAISATLATRATG